MVSILIALINNLPAILTAAAALTGVFVSLRNGRKTDRVAEQATDAATHASDAATKADALVDGQKEIHALVNSNLAKVKADLAEATAQITTLKQLVATLATKFASGGAHDDEALAAAVRVALQKEMTTAVQVIAP